MLAQFIRVYAWLPANYQCSMKVNAQWLQNAKERSTAASYPSHQAGVLDSSVSGCIHFHSNLLTLAISVLPQSVVVVSFNSTSTPSSFMFKNLRWTTHPLVGHLVLPTASSGRTLGDRTRESSGNRTQSAIFPNL